VLEQYRRHRYPDINTRIDGGVRNDYWTECMELLPDEFVTIRNHRLATAQSFGRARRPEPRTIPWLVALPLLFWMIWTGDL